ncbi:DNA/RNA non-specific endonuclease [Bradyrhizobium liaoningense]|uniref:DNA/RNA non-specific endonuclease n=1 Tax=Bradyrhizobium liaoningense TaxID=43992 RepID=UPI001BABD78D|nr:DNA/RNA non-specific endonuclease [Bradyrhizobium liaoningense]MBR1032611.1 DNA/RNA non-specific endonuclease [Bradyrhizobium liaoningense]
MSTSDAKIVSVRIESATPLTEISVSDSRFKKVRLEANSGPLELQLPPGVYEIAFRDGAFMHQQLAIVSANEPQPVIVRQKVVPSQPDEELEAAEPAGDANIRVNIRQKPNDDDDIPYVDKPTCGLSICDEYGTPLYSPDPAPGLLTFHADPGFYRLRLDTGLEGQLLETPIIVPPDWVVTLLCPLRRYRKDDYRADLASVQVRMHPQDSSSSSAPQEIRRLERKALRLLAGRRTLSGESFTRLIYDLLNQHNINPMFGFYAGHLLRIEEESGDVEILANLVDRLTELVDPNRTFFHPDIEALRLRLQLLRKNDLSYRPFTFPPMLAAGWRTILKVAATRSDLVPRGSVCDLVAPRLVASDAHMVWTLSQTSAAPLLSAGESRRIVARAAVVVPDAASPPAAVPLEDVAATEDGIHIIDVVLQSRDIRNWFRQECGFTSTSDVPDEPRISEAERAVALTIRPIAPTEKSQPIFERLQASERKSGTLATTTELAERLRLPIVTVERAVRSVSQKLTEQITRFGITARERAAMARPELIIPYDSEFLGDGFSVPMPSLSDSLRASAFASGAVLDYTHYSLVMHAERRVAIFTAHNVDASRAVRVKGGLTWKMDERAGENQLGSETYDGNQLDKGHLVRREDVLWGPVPEAKLANKATYFYTNAAPQHQNFNQDEWVTLEDWILDKATDFSYRLCVFTGPVLRSNDPVLNDLPPNLRTMFRARGSAQMPAAFWKVVVLRDATAGGEDLLVVCFAMRQSDMWNDRQGRRLLKLKVHQVTIGAIQEWTGLDFGSLNDVDELTWSEERTRAAPAEAAEAEWPLIRSAGDIVFSGPTRRLRGLRAVRGADAPRAGALNPIDAGAGHCADCGSDQSFNAREAIAAINREVARLTEVVAGMGVSGSDPAGGVRAALPGAEAAANAAPDDESIERMVAAAPDNMKDQVRKFAREVVTQQKIAKGEITVPAPTELERIVGGNRVQAGAIQSCVCIGDATQWFCTGVVVAPRVVLTAAHCGSSITRILIGDQTTPTLQGRVVVVRQAIIHPNYRRHPFNENDINILILDQDAAVVPARLATTDQLKQASQVHLVGFGYNDPQLPKGFGVKREVRAPMGPIRRSEADNLTQFEQLTGFHSAYEFVAGRKGLGRDTCNGDSGGPAYIDSNQDSLVAGLTSRATRDANVPCGAGGVYVRTDSFRSYINGVITAQGLPPLP